MSDKTDIKAVHDLKNSRGWEILKEVMEQEILSAAMQIGESPTMDINEVNFRRGSIWVANRMLEMPDRMIAKLEASIALNEDDKPISSDT